MAHLFFMVIECDDIERLEKSIEYFYNRAFYKRNDIPYCLKGVETNGASLYEVIPSGYIRRRGKSLFCDKIELRNPVALGPFLEGTFTPRYLVGADPFLLQYTMNYQKDVLKRLTDRTREGTVQSVLSERIKMNDLCLYAVSQHGSCLQYVMNQTLEVSRVAIETTPSSFRFCREPNSETIEFALMVSGRNLIFIPDELKTEAVCLKAVKSDGLAVAFVPVELQTPEICLTAVCQNPYALQYIRGKAQTAECAFRAHSLNKNVRPFMKEEYQKLLGRLRRDFASRFEKETVLMSPPFRKTSLEIEKPKMTWRTNPLGFLKDILYKYL